MGASLALGVTPGGTPLAHADATPTTPTTATTQPQAQPQKQGAPKAGEAKAGAANGAKKASVQGAQGSKTQGASTVQTAKNPVPVTNLIAKVDKGANAKVQDREATNDPGPQAKPDQGPQANNKITLSKETKDTLPNMYAWGSSDNTYIEGGQKQEVEFTLKPADGVAVTKVAIFPNDNIDIDSENGKKYIEYRSDNKDAHQSYSGKYSLVTNADGSAVLTMSPLFRDANLNGGAAYAANRCIYVYGTKDGQEVLLYKTNIARAATLIPPKKTGSIVLKYDEKLEEKTIREKLQKALDAPTEAKDGKSLNDQIKDASKAKGVGVRPEESKPVVKKEDVPSNKILVTDNQAYDVNQVNSINTPTEKQGEKVTAYKTGVYNLKTYLVSDLGYKSDVLPLTIARYDTRIVKPIVEDPTKVSDDVKKEIAKKLASLNHVAQDKVSINNDGTFTINFEGVDAQDAPKIALRDLVLKKIAEDQINVPAADKATVVYNPLGYSNAELERIKQSILDANKDNKDLGLTSTDQITLEYIKGDITGAGKANQGISNGQQENKITVKIKTDKAYAEFTSDVKQNKLTRLVDIRKDYDVSWDKTKIDGRDTDEGISWSNDSKTTIIYRYDPTKAEEFDTTKILGLLKATPKDKQVGLRDLTGGEALDHEDSNGKPRKSHMHYALKDDEPTGELSLGNMSGAYWKGDQKVSHSDEKLGDNLSEAGSYSWDTEAGSVTVAGKKDKIYKARLFVQPYAMTYYKDVYLEQGRNPGNTAKAINIIFVPQTNHKTKDLSNSIGEHKTESVEGKDVPTQSKYYNASGDKKEAYDKALQTAKTLYDSVKDTDESKLTEDQKAQIDNATITLNKARAELDGPDTNKEGLDKSITDDGTPAEGQQATTGTKASDKYKNVTDPDFKDANGNADTKKNEDAKKAKEAYDKALEEANKVKEDKNATQKAVDAAKAQLDAAREKLNDFTTSKDELSAAIATDGKVNTGEAGKTGDEKLKTADPTYQNSSETERKAYDDAVAEADRVSKKPNASQREVNDAIKKLKDAKKALDANATDKAPLDAAVQKSFDNPDPNDANKQSVFYKNAAAKKDTDPDAKKAVEDYDKALAEAKRVLGDENATKADVEKAKKDLEDAEAALHADKYQTKATDLAKAIADNFSGYLMPAYFNAFDKAQAEGKDSQAAKDFKAYNDAYHAAKDLMEQLKKPDSTIKQTEVDAVKNQLIEARKIIDAYATDTSRLSAAVFNDIAIKNSPAYKNLKALAEKTNPTPEEQADVEAAKKAMEAYKQAAEKLHNAITNKLPKDQANNQDIPDSNIPKRDGDLNNKDYLKDIQAHKNGEPLNRDVDSILQEMNAAAKELDKFKTNTDELIKSINEDDATKQTPAYKNASIPVFQKADSADADADKNAKAKQAVDKYGEMLNKAKDLLKDPNATQAQINEAKKNLDDARKTLLGDPKDQANTPGFNTDITKLQKSVDKHGKEKQGDTAATEGTVTSDAYRNASDPHFMKEEGGKLVPDDDKNKKAAEDKKAYDEALTKAQELLKKHDDKDTPQDAKPTQQQINDALKTLDEKRQALDTYKTNADALKNEADLSKADTEGASVDGKFENTPEFKNASYKQSVKPDTDPDVQQAKSDIDAYKKALKNARDLLAKKDAAELSVRPTQKQIDDALETLKNAKQAITDGYKTDTSKLNEAKVYANGDFKKTPEYKNAAALKDDQKADQTKKDAAKQAVDALDENTNDSALKKAKDIIDNPAGKTQKEVDEALKTLQDAMSKVTDNYKTDVKPLSNEVGDKDENGKDVIPPFEASVPYKNALEKAKTETGADAKEKLEAYAEKLKKAQDLIAQVNSTDPNADPDKKPTQAQVKTALEELQKAKKDITDKFKTNAKDLKKETNELKDDGQPKDEKEKFEKSTEYQNALAKTDADSKKDVQTYQAALKKANEFLELFGDDGTPKADIPAGTQIPTQQEVDDAKNALKEIKDKILANYKTNPKDLNDEVLQSQADEKDDNPNAFEVTAAFRNAQAKGDDAANQKIAAYKEKLDAAKKLLEAFDLVNGGVKDKDKLPEGMTQAPTQKQLDDALAELQKAKKDLTDTYGTNAENLRHEINNDFTSTQPYQNVLASWGAADISKNPYVAKYLEALNAAKAVLDRHDDEGYDAKDKPTQKEVDEALAKLKLAEKELSDAYNEPHAFLDPQTYGNTPSGGGAGGAGGAAGANTGEAGNTGAHDANKQNEGAHANHNANHDTNTTDTKVHQPQHAAHNNANADANANAAANANVAADALGTGAAQAPDGSKAGKDATMNKARLPKTSDALPLYANSAAVLVAIAVLTRTNRRRKKTRL